MSEEDAFRARLGSKDGTAMRVALGVLGAALILLVFAWYWPLHRAHAELRTEFTKATDTVKSLRVDLEKSSSALAAMTKARDELAQKEAERASQASERAQAVERLYGLVESAVKPKLDRKQLGLEKLGNSFSLTLQHRSLQKADSVDLPRSSAALLCKALEPIKGANSVRVRLQGLGTDAQSKSALLKSYKSGIEVGAARAARAAQTVLDCGIKPANLIVEAAIPARKPEETQTLRLVFELPAID